MEKVKDFNQWRANAITRNMLSRRGFLGRGSAAVVAASLVNGLIASDRKITDPGPANAPLDGQNPDSTLPPSTDAGSGKSYL